jgi:hypothetical protein
LAADVDAAAEAFDDLDRFLKRFPDPIVARVQVAAPQAPVKGLPHVGSVHAEPGRFEMLGFLAGVTLSAAIGALVYIYLALG